MKFSLQFCTLSEQPCDCIIVGVYEKNQLTPQAQIIDAACLSYISQTLSQGNLSDTLGSVLLLPLVPGIKSKRILLVQLGPKSQFGEQQFIKVTRMIFAAIMKNGIQTALSTLCELPLAHQTTEWQIRLTVIIGQDVLYQFTDFKNKQPTNKAALQTFMMTLIDKKGMAAKEKALREGQAISEGMILAKNLGNTPANICTPTYLAKQAKKLATDKNTRIEVLNEAAMKKLGMNMILAVGQGSSEPAKLIVVKYQGAAQKQKPIVFVGKGVTFDSGGISIKPAPGMMEMKFDMMGAACVLGVIKACQILKLPLNIIGIIPTVENLPSSRAVKPGDVITSLLGLNVEINNTDAEGRLILADALTYCTRFNPALVIDLATLTGAIMIALGNQFTGIFSTHENLRQALVDAGNQIHDLAWPMPLHENFEDELKSDCADLSNISNSRNAGACIAAQFLAQFTKHYTWAHLDIAGSAWPSGTTKLATGRPIPLLMQFLMRYTQDNSYDS